MNLFVLVSTGQKIANLPPVLELAQPGDQVLWIESDDARRGNWTSGPREVLQKALLTTIDVISVSQVNDPFLVMSILKPKADSLTGKFAEVYLVTNGGTKHTPIGLLTAFRPLSPKLLYGDERPAVYSIYPVGFTASPRVAPYIRHRLDLESILHVNGYTFATGSQHCRIWPDSAPDMISSERYGSDESYTCQLHAEHFAWASVNPTGGRISFDRLASLVPEDYQRWMRTLKQLYHAMNSQNMSNIYNGTLNLADAARHAAARHNRGALPPTTRIGSSLECAVARRVRAWQVVDQHPAIQSIWVGVKIARETTPHLVEAEFDVLIVLKNGVLYHLECKSAHAEFRDLDVNIHRLRQAGSQLARSAVVVPIYSKCHQQSWFVNLHNLRTRLEEQLGHQNVLPFTWPEQPIEYEIAEGEQTRRVCCIPFEEGLSSLLRPYRP